MLMDVTIEDTNDNQSEMSLNTRINTQVQVILNDNKDEIEQEK